MIKRLLNRIAERCGYVVFRDDVRFHPEECLKRLSERFGEGTVLDVGANVGQFGRALRGSGYRGRILSFEPLSSAYEKLRASAQGDDLWLIAPRCAVGAAEGTAEINIASNSASSSILEKSEDLRNAVPELAYVGKETISVKTLDHLVDQHGPAEGPLYLKIDTQGYERAVLEGAGEVLKRCRAVQMEMSLTSLYEGELLFDEVLPLMKSKGFTLFALFPGFCDRESGQTLQVDGIFIAEPSVS